MSASTDPHAANGLPLSAGCWRFDRYEFDARRGVFSADGSQIALRPKTFALLQYFVAHPGRLIPKEELVAAIWPGVVVTEDSLTQCVGELRAALGEGGARLIKTVPRRGYLLDAAVERVAEVGVSGERAGGGTDQVGAPDRIRARILWVAAAASLVLAVAAIVWWWPRPVSIDEGIAAQRAIAVLPFTDVSVPPAPAFAEAMQEDMTTAVAQLLDARVFAGGTTARFGGASPDVRRAGRELGASHLLTAKVQRNGQSALLWAQVQRTDTGAVVWSDRFEHSGPGHAEWQGETTRRIANAIDTRLRDAFVPPDTERGALPGPVDATQQAFYLTRHAKKRDDVLRARALLDHALAADPDSVVALTRWGLTHIVEVGLRWSPDREASLKEAERAFERALALRHNYAMAHYGRSNVLFFRGEVDEAARACEQALALAPNDLISLQRLGNYRMHQGRTAESLPLIQQALRLNMLDTDLAALAHYYLGMSYFHLQRDDEAFEEMRKAAAANPRNSFAWQWMAAIDALHGRDESARANLARFTEILPGRTVSGLRKAETNRNPTYQAERGRLYEGLAKAGLPP